MSKATEDPRDAGGEGRSQTAEPAAEAPPEPAVGLECPDCGCRDLRVWYTRKRRGGRVRRVRLCRHCGRRIATTEKANG